MLGDERLAKLVGAGNEAAFAMLYERHHQALYRYCRSLVGTDADAQDALQSAMTGALVALRAGRRDAPVRPWLFRIAHNEAISLLRRRRPEHELPEELHGAARSPHEVVEERARLATLVSDLQELPERQRGALVMRELSGLSHEEVAQAFDMTVGVAKQTVFEARRSLMDFAEGRAMACDDIRRLISDGDRRVLRGRRVRSHLRHCTGCTAFADAIPARQAELMALTPVLPLAAAAGLLARVTGTSASHGTAGGALLASASGKALTLGISGKALATGAAIVVVGTAGTTGALEVLSQPAPNTSPPPAQTHRSHAGANGSSGGTAATHSLTHRSAKAGTAGITGHSGKGGRSASAPGHAGSRGSSGLAPGHGGTVAPGLGGQVGSGAGALHNRAHRGTGAASTSHGQAATHRHGVTGASHRSHHAKRHHRRHHHPSTSTSHSTTPPTVTTPTIPTHTTPAPVAQTHTSTTALDTSRTAASASHTTP
jgi:RNA polymerase sigma factor (sigma-70 family)